MRNIFQVVAKENLIDQAAQANQDQNSGDPAKQLSAVDFDAELKRLGDASASDGAVAGGDVPSGDDAVDGSAETPPAPTPEGDDAEPENKGDADEGGEDGDNDNDDDDDDSDEAESAEPVPTDADLQKAAEGICRLVRCLQSIEEIHETGVVSPDAAAIAHSEIDTVMADMELDLPAAPATESLRAGTEADRFSDLKGRFIAAIRAAWKKFVEWLSKAAAWVRELRRAYQARKGVYDKTAEGYRARLKALAGQTGFEAQLGEMVTLDEITLGALGHYSGKSGVDGLLASAALLNITTLKVGQVVTAAGQTNHLQSMLTLTQKLENQPLRALAGDVEGFNIPDTLKATSSSNAIVATIADLTAGYVPATGKLGSVSVGGIPGGLTLNWTFGEHTGFTDLPDAAREISKVGFNVTHSEPTTTKEIFEINPDGVSKLLDIQKEMSSTLGFMLQAMSRSDASFSSMLSVSKTMLKRLEEYAHEQNEPASSVQDLVRIFTLISNSYEKAYIRPLNEMTRALGRGEAKLLEVAGKALVAIDAKLKPVDPKAKPAA